MINIIGNYTTNKRFVNPIDFYILSYAQSQQFESNLQCLTNTNVRWEDTKIIQLDMSLEGLANNVLISDYAEGSWEFRDPSIVSKMYVDDNNNAEFRWWTPFFTADITGDLESGVRKTYTFTNLVPNEGDEGSFPGEMYIGGGHKTLGVRWDKDNKYYEVKITTHDDVVHRIVPIMKDDFVGFYDIATNSICPNHEKAKYAPGQIIGYSKKGVLYKNNGTLFEE